METGPELALISVLILIETAFFSSLIVSLAKESKFIEWSKDLSQKSVIYTTLSNRAITLS